MCYILHGSAIVFRPVLAALIVTSVCSSTADAFFECLPQIVVAADDAHPLDIWYMCRRLPVSFSADIHPAMDQGESHPIRVIP
jgi:hypothetical protein